MQDEAVSMLMTLKLVIATDDDNSCEFDPKMLLVSVDVQHVSFRLIKEE